MDNDEVEELLQVGAAPLNALDVAEAPIIPAGALQGDTTWAHVPTGYVSGASTGGSSGRSGSGRERKKSNRIVSESGSESRGQPPGPR